MWEEMIVSKPLLSPEENLKLILKAQEEYQKFGSEKQIFQTEAILRNLKLVFFALKKYPKYFDYNCWFDEAYSQCLSKLHKCIITYNPQKGANFSTFVLTCLDNEIKMVYRYHHKREIESFDKVIYEKDQDEICLKDRLADPQSIDFENVMLQNVECSNLMKNLKLFLTSFEWDIYKMKLSGYSQIEIGKKYGKHRSYISKKLTKIDSLVLDLNRLQEVKNIEEFIEKQGLDGEQTEFMRVKKQFSEFIYAQKKMDFDFCYDYLKYSFRENGIVKKLDVLFKNKNKSTRVFHTLCSVNNFDIETCKNNEDMFGNIEVKSAEKKVKFDAEQMLTIASTLKKDKPFLIASTQNFKDSLTALAALKHFCGEFENCITEEENHLLPKHIKILKDKEKEICSAEKLIK